MPAPVLFLSRASAAFLALAPLVLPLTLVSLVRLVLEVVITALRAIFVAALQASGMVDPERIITVGLKRIITAVMAGETATMACLPTAIIARPMPMTAVTTPIGETGAWWFAAASDADNRAAQFLIHRSRFPRSRHSTYVGSTD
jgi:hypothetical protein